MAERVVWVVEYEYGGAWQPSRLRIYENKTAARTGARKLRSLNRGMKFRAWPYVAKESAQ